MKRFQQTIHSRISIRFVAAATFLFILSGGFLASAVRAQSDVNWSEPFNISRSGSATDPVMVVDSDGIYHVLWMDEFVGLIHSSGDGLEWSDPTPMSLPTNEVVPFLIADTSGYIHAFWTDIDGRLFYSRARASLLPSSTAWASRAIISDSVLDFDVALDESGDLHLSYVNPVDIEALPAGIYYRRLRNGTSTWLAPKLLYASPYFRSLELPDSNVDVSASVAGDNSRVYVVWDNRPRERIYLAISEDSGTTWGDPVEIDQPQSGIVSSGPSNVLVEANQDQVMLSWRMGKPDSFCNQYYQWSSDGGESWSLRQPIYGSTPICLDEVQIVPGAEYSILMGKADQVYFIAWDGSRWSDPQLEEPLTAFIDPDTQNPVELGCLQIVQNETTSMNVTGCDLGIGQDIWSLRRQLLDINDWFPLESGWGTLEDVDSDEVKLLSPKLVADHQGQDHLFWSKSDSLAAGSRGKSIIYAVRQEGQWSPSAEILISSTGKAEQIDAAIDSKNQLALVWSGGSGGEIYFSRADNSQAFIPESWSDPITLPSPLPVGSSPDILVDGNDNLYVSYAIPLNEQRGIYVTKSEDSGQSWSDAGVVFDAQAARWDMVDYPKLAITGEDDLHILWTRYSLPSGEGPLELYYANSSDGGDTWSDSSLVVEGPVVWSDIAGIGASTIQRVWQQKGSSGSTLWHEQSLDGGETWERISPVSVFGEIIGNPSLSIDEAGHLHLLLVVRSSVDTYALQHWVYDGQNWSAEIKYDLQFSPITEIRSIGSDFSDSGNLGVVLLNSDFSVDGSQIYQLIFTNQEVEVTGIEPTQTVQARPTQVSTPTPIPTAVKTQPAPTIEVTEETPTQFPEDQGNSGNLPWLGIIAPVAIGLIILIIIGLIVRWIRR